MSKNKGLIMPSYFSTYIRVSCTQCGKQFDKDATDNNTLCYDCLFPNVEKNKVEVVIKPELLDTSKLDEGKESKEFRPKEWDEYFGQESAKEKAKDFIKGCSRFNEPYPHTFISAPSGMGKSLFATILANKINKKIVFTTGGELKSEQIFVDKLVEADGGIMFVDEANRLPKRVGFFMLPLMEQFEIHGTSIKEFSLFFATTHKGDISKDLDALIQRCEQVNLEPYKNEELLEIVRQYNKKQYPSVNIPNDILIDIVNSCKQTPRNAKNLVKAFAYIGDWNKVKRCNNIIKDGLTEMDIRALTYLQNSGGAGQVSIANHLRVKPQTYLYDVEPYLIFKEFIEVRNKRKITEKGIALLTSLQGETK